MNTTQPTVLKFFNHFKPPEKLSLSEWSDKFAYLSPESSAEAGKWKTIPYQKGMMDFMTDPAIEQVSVMKSARVGYTKILNNLIGYHIHQDPCPIMLVQPTIEDAEGYSKEEIAPMIRDTPVLTSLVSEPRSKDGDNTILTKSFPGGVLGVVGANSARGFRRVGRRVVAFDETDGYPASAGTEGDQLKLGIRRTEYFWNRKIIAGSTPLIKDTSRIEKLYAAADQRYKYNVPCPTCDHSDYLVFTEKKTKAGRFGHFMKWPKDEPENAYFVCSKNGCVIEHKHKRWMVEEAERRQAADYNCGYGWVPDIKDPDTGGSRRHVAIHIWAAYSYSPNASWGTIAKEFLDSRKDPLLLQTFINTVLGEVWEEEYSAKIGAEGLQGRAEFYQTNIVPNPCVIVTAGIDIQDNRIECSRYAWAPGEESWLISHDVIFGDPAKPAIYKQLDDILLQDLSREDDRVISLAAAAIDTGGHHTHEIYQYVRERRRLDKIIGTKGQSQRGKIALGKPTTVDINMRGQLLKGGAQVYPMGSDTIKSVIYSRLKLQDPEHGERAPGYIHFPNSLPAEFFEQMTSEKQITRYVKGFPVKDWILPSGKRNEALDCAVLAYAALQWLYTKYHRATIWNSFSKKIGIDPKKPEESKSELDKLDQNKAEELEFKRVEETIRQQQRTPNSITSTRRKGGFVGRW